MLLTTVRQLLLSNVGFIILLESTEDERSLPIFIGAAEAQAIAFQLNKVELPRPLTHDLFISMLDAVGYEVIRIEIYDMQEGTFFANIILKNDYEEIMIDARPSDAIAISIRCDAPIFVDEKVMDVAGRIFKDNNDAAVTKTDDATVAKTNKGNNRHKGKLPHVPPLKRLEKSLEKAIIDERYEDAASLRDEINKLKDSHTDN